MQCIDFGLADYTRIYAEQRRLVQERIAHRIPDTLLIGEHPPVYTVGKGHRQAANLLPAGTVSIERGGQVTYHGPGQLIAYPIRYLSPGQRDLHRVLREMEDWIIQTLARFEIEGLRNPGWTGVWVAHPRTGERLKIASIGLAVKQWVTWHGLAVNLSTDLAAFDPIQPCGLSPQVMTSLEACRLLYGLPAIPDLLAQVKTVLTQMIVNV